MTVRKQVVVGRLDERFELHVARMVSRVAGSPDQPQQLSLTQGAELEEVHGRAGEGPGMARPSSRWRIRRTEP